MKVLVLHSSIRGEKSNSRKLAQKFLEGLKEKDNIQCEVEEVSLHDKVIGECLCCYSCWKEEHNGQCVQKDDMQELINKYVSADLVIWSFPLLFFQIPSKMKLFIERLLPLYKVQEVEIEGSYTHPFRKDSLQRRREVFISSCGFASRKNNYESVEEFIRIMFGDRADTIFCLEGTLFEESRFAKIVSRYLEEVKNSGRSYSFENGLSEKYKERLKQPFLPEKMYLRESNLNRKWVNTRYELC